MDEKKFKPRRVEVDKEMQRTFQEGKEWAKAWGRKELSAYEELKEMTYELNRLVIMAQNA